MREERVKLGPLFDVRLAPAFYGWLDAHTHKSSLKCYSGQTDLLLHIVGLCVCVCSVLQSASGLHLHFWVVKSEGGWGGGAFCRTRI